jgi:hypothetical protein
MTHDVVRLTDQFIFTESTDSDEILIDEGDLTFQIGL